jgi:FkbM family methyltransferase
MLYDYQKAGDLEPFGQVQYSQFGEDVVIWQWLQNLGKLNPDGFYVDVGAHHPRRMSNTKLLNKYMNWRGINIEPSRELWQEFEKERPDDINLNIACGSENTEMEMTIFSHQAVNSLDARMVAQHVAGETFDVVRTETVQVRILNEVLEEHVPPNREIGMISIDAEGFDFRILQSLDLQRWKPFLLCVEDHHFDCHEPHKSEIFTHMFNAGYRLRAVVAASLIFTLI